MMQLWIGKKVSVVMLGRSRLAVLEGRHSQADALSAYTAFAGSTERGMAIQHRERLIHCVLLDALRFSP